MKNKFGNIVTFDHIHHQMFSIEPGYTQTNIE